MTGAAGTVASLATDRARAAGAGTTAGGSPVVHYVSNSTLFSGAANAVHVTRMCEGFAASGRRVTLYCFAGSEGAVADAVVWARYGITHGFPVVQFARPRGWAGRLLYAIRAVRRVPSGGDHVVYTRDLPTAFVCTLLGRPFYLESHAPAFRPGLREAFFRRVFASPYLRRFVVVSAALRDWYAAAGYASPKVVVAHDAAQPTAGDVPVPAPMRALRARGALVVGYAGSLHLGKGMEVIVEVARRLAARRDVHFAVVGGDPASLALWQARTGDLPNVTLVGRVEPAEVAGFVAAFDVCLLPNQPRVATHGSRPGAIDPHADIGRFTSPLKLFEYMSHGKPVLASDLPVLREVVDDSFALLVPHDDPAAWARAIESLAGDAARRTALGAAGQRRFSDCHTWRTRADHVL